MEKKSYYVIRNEFMSVTVDGTGARIIGLTVRDDCGTVRNVAEGPMNMRMHKGSYSRTLSDWDCCFASRDTVSFRTPVPGTKAETGAEESEEIELSYTVQGNTLTLTTTVYNKDGRKPSAIYLTGLPCFNLSGIDRSLISDHLLKINASVYTDCGAKRDSGTLHFCDGHPEADFRSWRSLGAAAFSRVYARNEGENAAAELYSVESGISMTVCTGLPDVRITTSTLLCQGDVKDEGDVRMKTGIRIEPVCYEEFSGTEISEDQQVPERRISFAFSAKHITTIK